MSSTAGLTATGFVTPSLQTLLTQIQSLELSYVNPAIDFSSDQPLGQMNGIMASVFSDLWNALAAVYAAVDPNGAQGAQLDNVAALTGTLRPGAQPTVVTCTMSFTASCTVSAGAKASVTGFPGQVFALKNDVFAAAAGSVSGTTWVAVIAGPTVVQPATLTVIVTPVAGWSAITNPALGTTGQFAYTDSQLRTLRVQEIQRTGSCNTDSLRSNLLLVPGVINANVYPTTTDSVVQVTRSGGTATINRTPHSYEAVIWDGPSPAASNSAIAATLWANDPSGIPTVGSTTATTLDANGVTQVMSFSRATGRRLFITVVLLLDPTVSYAGDAAVQAALAAYVLAQQTRPGKELVAEQLRAVAVTVQGVLDISSFAFDFVPAPTNTANIFPGYDEVITLATSDISVSQ